tara:strand:+ start:486 stop:731 length:246 start_codon:yes stop_codon:yes gene_type:complete
MATISIDDLKSVVNIITICNKRGAFNLNELETIGVLYTKLTESLAETEKPVESKSLNEGLVDSLVVSKVIEDENGGHSLTF